MSEPFLPSDYPIPTVHYSRSTEIWLVHRADGATIHRLDGPAVTDELTGKSWYIDGNICYTNAEFQAMSGLTDEEMLIMIIKYGNVYF